MPIDFEIALKTEVRHDGRDDGRLGEQSLVLPVIRDDCQRLVAIDQVAALVDNHHAIGVAIERNADIGAHFPYFSGQRFGRRRTAIAVDVEAVRLDADGNHFRTEFPKRLGRHAIGRAVGAIHHDAQSIERHVFRQRPLGKFYVAILHAVDALGAPQRRRLRQPLGEIGIDQPFDLSLVVVREFEAVRGEQFYPVVVVEVMRS